MAFVVQSLVYYAYIPRKRATAGIACVIVAASLVHEMFMKSTVAKERNGLTLS
jgi:hypothetical protein